MQVDPLKPQLKPPGTKRLKPECDILLSTSAFKFSLRRYIEESKFLGGDLEHTHLVKGLDFALLNKVGWCRLTASKPVLKVPMISELETRMW